jgi:hypothetical protein
LAKRCCRAGNIVIDVGKAVWSLKTTLAGRDFDETDNLAMMDSTCAFGLPLVGSSSAVNCVVGD